MRSIFVVCLVACAGFATTANATPAYGTYTMDGDSWFTTSAIPGGDLYAFKVGTWTLQSTFDWGSYGLVPGGFQDDYQVDALKLTLGPNVFGEVVNNADPMTMTGTWTFGPGQTTTLDLEGAGVLTTGQPFTFSSHYEGTWVPFGSGASIGNGTLTTTVSIVPAPGAIVLCMIGTSVVGWLRRRRSL